HDGTALPRDRARPVERTPLEHALDRLDPRVAPEQRRESLATAPRPPGGRAHAHDRRGRVGQPGRPSRSMSPAGAGALSAVESRRIAAPSTSANTPVLERISSAIVATGVGSPGTTPLAKSVTNPINPYGSSSSPQSTASA